MTPVTQERNFASNLHQSSVTGQGWPIVAYFRMVEAVAGGWLHFTDCFQLDVLECPCAGGFQLDCSGQPSPECTPTRTGQFIRSKWLTTDGPRNHYRDGA